MVRRFFTLALLLICILWLIASYLPGVQALLPTIAFPPNNGWLTNLAVASLVLFLAIQLWLLYATIATVRAHQTKGNGSPFRLKLSAEFLWTALPIAMTIGLAWASYARWLNQ